MVLVLFAIPFSFTIIGLVLGAVGGVIGFVFGIIGAVIGGVFGLLGSIISLPFRMSFTATYPLLASGPITYLLVAAIVLVAVIFGKGPPLS